MTDDDSPDDRGIDRRTYLQLAAAAVGAAGAAGGFALYSGGDQGERLHFGYGGGPILVAAGATALATSESEANDAMTDADAIGTDTDVSGTLETAGVDWYAFEATADQGFDVVFDRETTDGVTSVVVYGPDGEFAGLRQVGTGQQVRIPETPTETGTHYLEVADVQAGDGAYTVRIDTGDSMSTDTATATATDTATPSPTPTATDTASPTPSPTPTDTPTATPSPTPSPTATEVVDEYGEQGYGEYGYGGVSS